MSNVKYQSISSRLADMYSTYQEAFFRLNNLFLEQRVQHRLEIPENYKKLSASIFSQRNLPYYTALAGAVCSMGGAALPDSYKIVKALADSVGKVGVSCIKESFGYSYESRHTGLRGLIQTAESEAGTLHASENEISAEMNEIRQTISTIAKAEESIAGI